MASVNATNITKDFYNRVSDMCKEAVTGSIVVPDFIDKQAGGLWWVIKHKSDSRIHGNQRMTRRRANWEVVFILGSSVSAQGMTRESLYDYKDTILLYFESHPLLTTTTSDSYAEIEGAITFDLVGEEIVGETVKYRALEFALSFVYSYGLTRSI